MDRMTRDKMIVIGVDGSPPSLCALRWATRYAARERAAVHIVHAWQPLATPGWSPLMVAPDVVDLEKEGRRVLEEGVAGAREHSRSIDTGSDHELGGIEIRPRLVEGHPAPVLLAQAEGADLLVVGTHGHGAFTGMLLGSVSAHVIGRAPCPVVVVPMAPGDASDPAGRGS